MTRRRLLIAALSVPVLAITALGGVIAFGTAKPPPPMTSVDGKAGDAIDSAPLPRISRLKTRDGSSIAYRVYHPTAQAAGAPVAILIHGSSGSSANMNLIGLALAQAGVTSYAPDIRGHGESGRRGDVEYIGQLEDDLADLAEAAKTENPGAKLVLAGHSSGGGFTLRVAGTPTGRLFDRFVLLAPYLGQTAPSTRPAAGGWVAAYTPRIAGLTILNHLGITALNGLPVLAFASQPHQPVRTWTFRLMDNFGPHGMTSLGKTPWMDDARKVNGHVVLLAGTDDESFVAERYAQALAGLQPAMPITIVPHVGHMDLLSDPAAVTAVVAAIKGAP